MMLFETHVLLCSFCLIAFAVNYVALSEESCYRFRGKTNVTMDTDQCLWQNCTDAKTKIFCLESCFKNVTVSYQIKAKAIVTTKNSNMGNT